MKGNGTNIESRISAYDVIDTETRLAADYLLAEKGEHRDERVKDLARELNDSLNRIAADPEEKMEVPYEVRLDQTRIVDAIARRIELTLTTVIDERNAIFAKRNEGDGAGNGKKKNKLPPVDGKSIFDGSVTRRGTGFLHVAVEGQRSFHVWLHDDEGNGVNELSMVRIRVATADELKKREKTGSKPGAFLVGQLG